MKKKHVIIIVILVAILAGAYYGVRTFVATINTRLEELVNSPQPTVDLSKVPAGVYTGRYKVFPVAVEVKVTVKDHLITGIELVKHQNGRGTPAEAITGKVVEAQTLAVDTVAGATYSSKVILKAIEDALNSGGTP